MQPLEICTVCRRVQDKNGMVFQADEWGSLWTYIERSSLPASAIILTAAYCPDCSESYRLLMAYGRADQALEHSAV